MSIDIWREEVRGNNLFKEVTKRKLLHKVAVIGKKSSMFKTFILHMENRGKDGDTIL